MSDDRRILIVDDDREMVSSLLDIVGMGGWQGDGVYSGEQAVDAFGESDYDAVLMDIRMPGMNGVEAVRAMKSRRPEVPVLLMTAYSSEDLIAEADAEGVERVLRKPVPVVELLRLLDRVVA